MVFRHSQAPAHSTKRNNEKMEKEEERKTPIFAVIGPPTLHLQLIHLPFLSLLFYLPVCR
jgi:hypothetical protein